MKIICLQENLIKGLQTVSHLAGKNSNLPILNNVLITAEEGIISLTTTNLEIGVNCKIRGKVEKKGKCTVQARLLTDFIGLLPKDNIILEYEDNKLKIECGNDKSFINTLSPEDFPLLPKINKENEYILNTLDLKDTLKKISFAISYDSTRPEISGVLINLENSLATFVGTDSYRLAEKSIKINKFSNEKRIIIPLDTIQEVSRIINYETQEDVKIYIEENQILFEINGIELVSRLIEGSYPDYKQIIPKEFKTKSEVKTNELIQAIKRTSLFCKPGINDIKLTFVTEKGELVINSISDQIGESMTIVKSNATGDDNEIVFNYKYILDALSNIDSETVSFEIIDNKTAGIVKTKEDDSYLYIIMPIRQ
ncbi:MAG: DNA polymerase III subunit beta [Patescibacteria group bacterium]|nr:DNA polymerase III subunit beta [Patescibacteria group bacterium]